MKSLDVQAIRYANLLLLLKECGEGRGAQAKLAEASGVKSPYISQLVRRVPHSSGAVRTMGDPTARALEKGMGKPRGWMDHDHSDLVDDESKRLASIARTLTPEQRQILWQTAVAFAKSNGKPPPEDGPELRQPRPRQH